MIEMKIENWNGYNIRFVHVNGAWVSPSVRLSIK